MIELVMMGSMEVDTMTVIVIRILGLEIITKMGVGSTEVVGIVEVIERPRIKIQWSLKVIPTHKKNLVI